MKKNENPSPQEKAYKILDKLEVLGAKSGFVVNRKVTKLGSIVAAIITVSFFGGYVLLKAFWKHASKKSG